MFRTFGRERETLERQICKAMGDFKRCLCGASDSGGISGLEKGS